MFIQNKLGLIESIESMMAQEQRLNQVSNNLANVDTAGFKKDNVTFWETLYNVTNDRQRVGKAIRANTIHEQGVVQKTENELDVAITGRGFFKIQTPQGIRYSRAGNFQLNNVGQLVTPNGHPVIGDGGPIVINGQKVDFSSDGQITVDGQRVNVLALADVEDPRDLVKEGANLFRLKNGVQEQAAQGFVIHQGFLEKSNVNSVKEMTEMIDLHRAFEGQQKAVRAIDDIDDMAVRRVGSLNG